MRLELVRRFGSTMLPDIFGVGDELAADRCNPSRNKIRVTQVASANGAIKTFADDVDETVTIVALQMKARMLSGHPRQHGCQMRGTEGERRRDPKSSAQIAR